MPYNYDYGNGTEQDPYQVWTAEDLNGVRDHTDKYFIQMADVDLTSYDNWVPIGDANRRFQGHYDGDSFTVSNLTVTDRDYYGGLFGQPYGACSIANVTLKDISISGGNSIGGLAGQSYGGADNRPSIENCQVTGTSSVSGTVVGAFDGDIIGGLIGVCYYTDIVDCGSNCTVSGVNYVGGMTGKNYSSTIKKTSNSGNVTGDAAGWAAGGISGYSQDTDIENCYANGDVSGNDGVGGLIGDASYTNEEYHLLNSYFAGGLTYDAEATYYGGIIGASDETLTVTSSYYDSEKTGLNVDNYGALPRTTAEMTYPYDTSVNQTYVGWDFGTTWHHDKNLTINEGYPHFKKLVYKILIPITGGIVTYL